MIDSDLFLVSQLFLGRELCIKVGVRLFGVCRKGFEVQSSTSCASFKLLIALFVMI